MTPLPPPFREALRFWAKLGCISFGGPAAQIALMHREFVEKRRWVDEAEFRDGLSFCMLLPGPEAQQLAVYVGWLLHGVRGGLVAGLLFIIPSMFVLWLLSVLYVTQGSQPWFLAMLLGIQPVVVAIVAASALRLAGKVLKSNFERALAAAAFTAIFGFKVPFPWVLAVAVVIGILHRGGPDDQPLAPSPNPRAHGTFAGAARVLAIGLSAWLLPLLAIRVSLGADHVLYQLGSFFSRVAVMTFGGAYAVLPHVAREAVEQHHWLTTEAMLAGLAFAETTPGPLIMVLQFVGFMAAWNETPSLGFATAGALVVTWATFAPCFLFIFLGAPWISRIRELAVLRRAFAAISAIVVGVIISLGVWLGQHVFVEAVAVVVFVVALVALQSKKVGILGVVGSGAAFGLLRHLLTTTVS